MKRKKPNLPGDEAKQELNRLFQKTLAVRWSEGCKILESIVDDIDIDIHPHPNKRCSKRGCITKLTRYNLGKLCFYHHTIKVMADYDREELDEKKQ